MQAIVKSKSPSVRQQPTLLVHARELARYVADLSPVVIARSMHVSDAVAVKTKDRMQAWSERAPGLPAIDAFLGDIYSGLQAASFSPADRAYANQHLYILSGLYGVLRALDIVVPYRLEMGYRLPKVQYSNLYKFWGERIAALLPQNQTIYNLSAVEYTKAVLPYMKQSQIITPKFMTVSPKTGEPVFVVVHAKIARGAFARWLIQNRIENVERLREFAELNYVYNQALSTTVQPVFVCQTFGGLGLSVRLT